MAQSTGGLIMQMTILLPPLTDIRDSFSTAAGSSRPIVEVPAGSKRYYGVTFVDDIGKGFPNEHRFACIIKLNAYAWPEPYP